MIPRALAWCARAPTLSLALMASVSRAAPPEGPDDAASAARTPADPDAPPQEVDPGWVAPADDAPAPERARAWFLRADEQRRAGRFADAAEAFARSYEAVQTADGAALFNSAVAWEYADRPIEALEAYERYLTEVGEETADAEAARVAIGRLERRVARIDVRFADGATAKRITIDDREVEVEALPVRVLPGRAELRVELHGGEARDRVVDLEAGTTTVIDLDAVELSATEPPGPRPGPVTPPVVTTPPPGRDGEGRSPALRPLFWAGLGLTVASSIGTATLGGLTLSERAAYEEGLCESPCPEGSTYPADHERRFEALRTGTNVMIGVTAALAVTTTVIGAVTFARPRRGAAQVGRVQLLPARLRLRF